MRHKPKWFIGATIPIAAGSLAVMVAGALPAMAQETSCPHHAHASTAATTVHAVTTARCVEFTLATPVKAGRTVRIAGTADSELATPVKAEGTVVIVTKAGKAARTVSGLIPVAISSKVCPTDVTAIPSQGGQTGVAPS